MSARLSSAAVVFVALALAAPARGQPKALQRADDIDLSPRVQKKVAPEEPPEDEGAADPGDTEDTYIPGRMDRAKPRAAPAGDEGTEAVQGAPDAGLAAADAGSPGDAGVVPAEKQVKPLVVPPPDGDAQLSAAWAERRKAVEKHAVREVLEAERKIQALREELGYPNLFAAAVSLCGEVEGLMKTDGAEAVRRAVFASEIAPDLPAVHWMVARAAFTDDLTNCGRYLGSSIEALKATWREPRARAALVAEVAAAVLAAFLLAGAACIAVIFLRHARCFLHDFHHLFPAGAWRLQTSLTGLLVVALPLLFGWGPVAFLFGLSLATWLHMERAERSVVVLLFVLVGLVPLAASRAERWATFAGTRAETVYLVERGGLEPAPWAELQALAERPDAPYPAVFALGHRARRQGDAAQAVRLLRQAAELRPDATEALIELGDALFLAGDIDGARETYQRVLNAHDGSAEAHYNLARLFDRRAQMVSREEAAPQLAEAQSHSHRVIDLDPQLGASLAGEPDLHANRFLAGASLSSDELWEMSAAEAHPAWLADDLSRRLLGPFPSSWAWVAGLVAAGLLGLASLLRGVLAPSGPCGKCGRPVCRRCDAEVVGPGLCGQCVNVYARRGAVDAPVRAAKELGIRRYLRRRLWSMRAGSILLGGAGQVLVGNAGRGLAIFFGAALGLWFIVFPGGVVAAPWGASPVALRVVPAALLVAVVWGLAVRRTFRDAAAMELLKPGATGPAAEPAAQPEAGA